MKKKIIYLAASILLVVTAQAGRAQTTFDGSTFTDGLTVSNAYWTYGGDGSESETFSSDGLTLGGSSASATLNLVSLGTIPGDFAVSINFTNVSLGRFLSSVVELQLAFGNGMTGSILQFAGTTGSSSISLAGPTNNTAGNSVPITDNGTLSVSQTDDVLTMSFADADGVVTLMDTNSLPVTQITFNSDDTTTTFNNFSVSGIVPTPEPSALALAGLGGFSLFFFRRRK